MNGPGVTSGPRIWRNVVRLAPLLFLALFACAIPPALFAQEKPVGQTEIITLIPAAVSARDDTAVIQGGTYGEASLTLTFAPISLPSGAELTNARLSLVAGGETSAKQDIEIEFRFPDSTSGRFATLSHQTQSGERAGVDAGSTFVRTLNGDRFRERPFLLSLQTKSNAESRWYSLAPSVASGKRPRLILEYRLAGQPGVPQSDGRPDVRSPRAYLPVRAGASDGFSYVTRPFPKAWSYTPAFANHLVYLLTDDNGQKTLRALTPLGETVWPALLPEDPPPGQHLLVSKGNRLFIVGNGSILVYQLDPKSPAAALLEERRLDGLNPALPPALGPEGSLYVVNGQEVFGFSPSLQELWKVTLHDKAVSRLTVGPGGRFVYLTAKHEGLVAINSQTGDYVSIELPNQKTLQDTEIPTLHAPVTVRHPDGSEIVFVAANSVGDGVLSRFAYRKMVERKSDPRTNALAELWSLPGPWSQPIPDQIQPESRSSPETANPDKKIYAVRVGNGQGTVEAIDWLDGSMKTSDKAATLAVADARHLLSGGLAMDLDGHRYLWNGASGTPADMGLYAFGAATSGRLKLPLDPASGIPVNARLLFGSDGTLYALGPEDDPDRILRAIVPKYILDGDRETDIASPTHLLIGGTAGRATTLKAGGSLFLAPGFGVRKGHTLSISTGAAESAVAPSYDSPRQPH